MNAASPNRYSFLLKLAGAILLVALADLFFWFQRAGSTIGLFALALLVVAACMRVEMFARWRRIRAPLPWRFTGRRSPSPCWRHARPGSTTAGAGPKGCSSTAR